MGDAGTDPLRRLDRASLEDAADRVDDERREGFRGDILRDEQVFDGSPYVEPWLAPRQS